MNIEEVVICAMSKSSLLFCPAKQIFRECNVAKESFQVWREVCLLTFQGPKLFVEIFPLSSASLWQPGKVSQEAHLITTAMETKRAAVLAASSVCSAVLATNGLSLTTA